MHNYILCLLVLLISATTNKTSASECYFYHTNKKHTIVQKEGKYFIAYTELDPNGITIVRHELTALKNRFKGKIKELSNANGTIVFSDDENFYAVAVGSGNNDNYKVFQIATGNDIRQVIDGRILVYKSGKTQLLQVYPYADNPDYKELKNFPSFATLITSTTQALLLKNSKDVFLYDIENDSVQTIPGLDAKTVVFKLSPEPYEVHFLYDENTFYLLDDGHYSFTDVTDNFSAYPVNFLTLEYMVGNYLAQVYFKDTANHILWTYIKSGMSIGDGDTFYFYPLKNAAFVNNKLVVLQYKNKYYLSGWDAVYEYNELNISAVKSLQNLAPYLYGEYIYDDGSFLYRFDHDNSKFIPFNKLLSNKAIYYPAIKSYMHGTSPFYDDNGVIKLITYDFTKIVREIPHQTPVKNLKIAYAFDDKLFIENTLISSAADFETITYLKSMAEPVEPCDGGDGQIQIIVNYSYFFKDKNNYYQYRTGDNALKKMTAKQIKDEGLDSIATDTSSNASGNSLSTTAKFLIGGATLLAAGSVAWILKRK